MEFYLFIHRLVRILIYFYGVFLSLWPAIEAPRPPAAPGARRAPWSPRAARSGAPWAGRAPAFRAKFHRFSIIFARFPLDFHWISIEFLDESLDPGLQQQAAVHVDLPLLQGGQHLQGLGGIRGEHLPKSHLEAFWLCFMPISCHFQAFSWPKRAPKAFAKASKSSI